MRFIVSAPFSFIFLVHLIHFLLRWVLVSLIHHHLVAHEYLLGSVLLVVWHHSHHLWVVQHLIRHLTVVALHLLHAHSHVSHVSWHSGHLVCTLHLIICVHIKTFINDHKKNLPITQFSFVALFINQYVHS